MGLELDTEEEDTFQGERVAPESMSNVEGLTQQDLQKMALDFNSDDEEEFDLDEPKVRLDEFGQVIDDADVISDEEWERLEKEERRNKPTFCQRCYRLRNYGMIDDELRPGWSKAETLMPEHFRKLIDTIKLKKCIIVTLVDVFDFHGSMLPDIAEIAGDNPVIVAVNKVDLLPADYQQNYLRAWI